jgi:hypothetical protein
VTRGPLHRHAPACQRDGHPARRARPAAVRLAGAAPSGPAVAVRRRRGAGRGRWRSRPGRVLVRILGCVLRGGATCSGRTASTTCRRRCRGSTPSASASTARTSRWATTSSATSARSPVSTYGAPAAAQASCAPRRGPRVREWQEGRRPRC